MKLTIAHFATDLRLAGLQRVITDLARAFLEKGHRSLVCTTRYGGELVQELENSGVSFKCLDLKKSYDLRALFPVIRYLKKNKIDVVITHGNYRIIPRIAAILSQTPAIIHVEHNVSFYKRFHHILINRILSIFTDKIICISENARKSLMQIEHINSSKVAVIPNGLNSDRFSTTEIKDKKQNAKKKVGIVGRFNEQKGHIYFVEAAVKVVQSYKNVEFIFVGDGPLRSMIEEKVREYGLDTYSHFMGVRSDVDALFRTFDVFVLSSLWEGLPISLLEAQYFGIASVVTEVGGNSEVVENGYNGLLVPPKNPNALASAILRVLNNDELRNQYGLNGKNIINQRFSVEKMSNEYLNQINSILRHKRNNDK